MTDDLYLLIPTRVIHALENGAPDDEILDYLQAHTQGDDPRAQAQGLLAMYKDLIAGSTA